MTPEVVTYSAEITRPATPPTPHRKLRRASLVGLCLALATVIFGGGCGQRLSPEAQALEKRMGIAIYPGAKINQSSMVVGPKSSIGAASLSTTDNYADVVKFYRDKYAGKATVRVLDEGVQRMTLLSWRGLKANSTIVIKRDDQAKATMITLALTGRGE